MDPGDDLLPGSGFLDVFGTQILVRAERIRVFNAVKEAYLEDAKRMAVVTAQPGIGLSALSNLHLRLILAMNLGKTFWIRYAMRRCLGEKQEVI